jgi:hypothetical protein
MRLWTLAFSPYKLKPGRMCSSKEVRSVKSLKAEANSENKWNIGIDIKQKAPNFPHKNNESLMATCSLRSDWVASKSDPVQNVSDLISAASSFLSRCPGYLLTWCTALCHVLSTKLVKFKRYGTFNLKNFVLQNTPITTEYHIICQIYMLVPTA